MGPHRSSCPAVLVVAVGVALLVAGLVAGCSGPGTTSSGETRAPSASATATATGTTGPSAPGSPSRGGSGSTAPTPSELPTDLADAVDLHLAVLGSSVATTPEERQVVEAWMGFWQAAADSYYAFGATPELRETSQDGARESVVSYLQTLKDQGHQVVGWSRDHVTSVIVHGDEATLRDCTENFTFSVDRNQKPVTRPVPFYDVTGQLRRRDGHWVVVDQTSRNLRRSCLG